ncbi:MAG: DUF935 family protein [Terracidiphilus sp.]|nr:DUF935 family protein [Terracidiphilus sp.]
MADQNATTQAVPPVPEKGAVVSEQALYLTEISLYRNTMAFGGTRNPTAIWEAMSYNLPQTMGYYRELEDKDEDVSNALDTLKLSVTRRPRSIQPANDNDSKAVEIKEFIEQQLDRVDFDSVLDSVLDAVGYGFSVQEKIFDISAGQVQLQEVADCPQELFLFGNRFRPQIGKLQYLDQPWASEGKEMDENKFIITTYRGKHRNRMGRPLLKNIFWPSWFKRNIQRLWVQFAEKGPGTAVVYYNDADNTAEKMKATEIAQAIINNVAIAVPQTMKIEIELLKLARSQNPDVYEKFFTLMQYAITRRVLGETLTSFGNEGGHGSNAQGQVHADTLDNRSVTIAKQVMKIVNCQIIAPLVLWNYGPKAPMPTLKIEVKPSEDLVKRLAVDAGLQRMGKKFTVGYIAERYDVPLAQGENGEDPEDILIPNAAAPNVAITDQARATFGEGSLHAEAQREQDEFDQVFAQLQKGATGVLRERVAEIAREVTPIVRP